MTQVLRIALIDIGGLSICHQQDELAALRLRQQVVPRMSHGGSHSCRQATLHAVEPRFGLVVELLVEVLESIVVHVVASLGGKPVHGKRVADSADGRADKRRRFARKIQHRFPGAIDRLVRGL